MEEQSSALVCTRSFADDLHVCYCILHRGRASERTTVAQGLLMTCMSATAFCMEAEPLKALQCTRSSANDLHVCHRVLHGGSASEGHYNLVLTPAHQAASVCLKLPEQLTVRESVQAQGSWQVQNCSWWLHRSCLW